MAVIARDLAAADLIQRRRDRTHAVLGQHKAEQARKLLRIQLVCAEDADKLIHHAAQDRPQLRQLLSALRILRSKALRRELLKLLRHGELLQISVQRAHLLGRRTAAADTLCQAYKGPAHTLSQGVDLLQPRAALVIPPRAVALRVRRPGGITCPHAAADLPLEHVVFQHVALLAADTGQSCFQAAEHVFIFKLSCCGVQRAEQQGQHLLLQDIAPAGAVKRHAVAGENRL